MKVDPRTPAPSQVPPPDPLERIWGQPPGLAGWFSAVNHKLIGRRFMVTAFVFFLIGGIEALLVRTQLVQPEMELLGPDFYNQMFTMHGTTMMFLFIIPMIEGLMIYFVPLQIGTRDLPFPRLNAFSYWTLLFGGIFLHTSFLVRAIPDGGWFAYVPLTGPEFRPDLGLDFWLLGVTFVEIGALVAAVEIIVLILRQRAPGMSLSRMPLFVWGSFVTSFIVLFAFPPLIVGTILLEADRKLGTLFYDTAGGGEPHLWQHLFWFFGHPDVYIMLLPAIGIVALVLPVFARTRIVGYVAIASATVAIAVISFGVWVHHMYAVGLPMLVLAFFAASSLIIAIPSGVQIFAFIATLWKGTRLNWTTPMLFAVGFIVLFVAGGITGVMLGLVPFDLQVHDSFFVVAHFHYVIIGGVLFPFFAGFHYWWPKVTGRVLSERLGHLTFWLMFVGFNLGFFPQHILGLQGMPRRVHTYPEGLGWDALNLASTIGAFILALGVLVFLLNAMKSYRRTPTAGPNPWNAGTLEWAVSSPPPMYNFRRFPIVRSTDPLWDRAGAPDDHVPLHAADEPSRSEGWELDAPADGVREVLGTGMLDAEPEEVLRLPGNSYAPVAVAASIAILLVGVLVDSLATFLLGAVLTVAGLIGWIWQGGGTAPLRRGELYVEPAAGHKVGVQTRSLGFMGALVGLAALGTGYGTFGASYLYLFVRADQWPPSGIGLPEVTGPAAALVLPVAAALTSWAPIRREPRGPAMGILAALVLGAFFLGWQSLAILGAPFSHDIHAYGSLFHSISIFHGLNVLLAISISLVAFIWHRRRLDPRRAGVAIRIAALWWTFTALMSVWVFAVLYLTPNVASGLLPS
jgi:cytochrome c oxidase subunit I+III